MPKPNVISKGVATVPILVNGVLKSRYSDEELAKFKEIILEKRGIAHEIYLMYRGFDPSDNSTNDTSPTFKILEEGSYCQTKEVNDHLAKRQLKFISLLDAALVRIENKTYGVCHETGRLISVERLMSCPHTTSSILFKGRN